jgi:hypothetical protein
METLGSLYQALLQETQSPTSRKLFRQPKITRDDNQPLFWIVP